MIVDIALQIVENRACDAESFGAVAEKLDKLADNAEYGYLFRTMRDLCKALAIKADIVNV